jgi:hypothetical protein
MNTDTFFATDPTPPVVHLGNMHITISKIDNIRSSFHGCFRANLHIDGRIVWSTDPYLEGHARKVAAQLWPTLLVKG